MGVEWEWERSVCVERRETEEVGGEVVVVAGRGSNVAYSQVVMSSKRRKVVEREVKDRLDQ